MRLLEIVVVPALVLAVPSAGCAALGAKAPDPNRSDWERPVCNSGKGAVAVDAVLAMAFGVGGIAAVGDSGTAGALLFLVAGAYTISAVAGNGSATKCQAAQREYAAYQQDERSLGGLAVAPGAQSPPPPPLRAQPPQVVPATPVRPPGPAVTPPKPAPAPSPPPADETYPEPADEGDDGADAEADAAPAPDESGNPWHAFWREVP